MNAQFLAAINQLADEKNLPRDTIIDAVEAALAAAYKKDYGDREQIVRVKLNEDSGAIQVFVSKRVVGDDTPDEDFNGLAQVRLSEAKKKDKDAKVIEVPEELGEGEEPVEPYLVEYEVDPGEGFGRVAAQTAKQVIIQRLREAEREIVFNEYKDKEGVLLSGNVQRVDGNLVYVDIGKTNGVLFASEQIPGERYYPGQRVKVYIVRVEQAARGPQVVISRAHAEMVRRLFELEVPEIETGTVEIKNVAREAGTRSKVAVESHSDSVDPVGTFVGGRGARVQAVMGELGEEKIDIILYSETPETYIINALSPTKVVGVELHENEHKAVVKVPEDQLSLAIGKQGQNVRLAAKLTGWNIDIVSADESRVEATADASVPKRPGRPDLEGSLIDAVNQQSDDSASAGDSAPAEAETRE